MRTKRTLASKIGSRLVAEAIIGIVLYMTYPHWDEITAAFRAVCKKPEN